jgi:hypothetical protein
VIDSKKMKLAALKQSFFFNESINVFFLRSFYQALFQKKGALAQLVARVHS